MSEQAKLLELMEQRIEDLECEKDEVCQSYNYLEKFSGNMKQELEKNSEENEQMKDELNGLRVCVDNIQMRLKVEDKPADKHPDDGSKEGPKDVLKAVDMAISKVVQEREILQKENEELREQLKFNAKKHKNRAKMLEARISELEKNVQEQKILQKENDKLRENHKVDAEKHKKRAEMLKAKTLELEKNNKYLNEQNTALDDKAQFMFNCCGKIFNEARACEAMAEKLKRKSKIAEKLVNKEQVREMRLIKKIRAVKKRLRVSRATVARERRLKNALGSNNLQLKLDLETLEKDVACYDWDSKDIAINSMKIDELTDRNNELQENIDVMRVEISRTDKEKSAMQKKYNEIRLALEEERGVRSDLEEKIEMIAIEKDVTTKHFHDEMRKCDDLYSTVKKEITLREQTQETLACVTKEKNCLNTKLGEERLNREQVEQSLEEVTTRKNELFKEKLEVYKKYVHEKNRRFETEYELAKSVDLIEELRARKRNRFIRALFFRRFRRRR
eukprot:Seg7481.1 transcript_id=Seg7481.1/GoldUCD/mRNA.D3Y31 product="hypothetical protein" protein_id=Seg7481.1/GoldUCD/D3Y31